MITKRLAWSWCVLALVVGACATVPRLEAPKVIATELRVDRLTGVEAQFTVTLTLANPNNRDLNVDAIEATVRIEDVPVGVARLTSPVRLVAYGEAPVALAVRAGLADALRAAVAVAKRAEAGGTTPATARYAVTGTAVLEGGMALPFSRSGEFALPARMTAPR
ncbi:MAG: LEA type 2 family protein [Betaproteobacteria bacterium]